MRAIVFVVLLFMSGLSGATEWTLASELAGAKPASAEEKALWRKRLANMQVHYNFEDTEFQVHRGDLMIDGNFYCDTLLIVDGNLKISGMYDDYRANTGVLVVSGDMAVDRLYSWGAVYVAGDLNVTQLALSVYNDFTFEVGGKVHARALVLSDKSNAYTPGEIVVELGSYDIDPAQYALALRHFVPDVFTQPDHFDAEMDDDFYGLTFDDGFARTQLTQNISVFRTAPAAESLPKDVLRVMQSDVPEAELLQLLEKDLLLAQLIATRENLSDTLARALLRKNNETIQQWLARSKPALVHAQGDKKLTPRLALALAENPDTSIATLQAIAEHTLPAVRVASAKHPALADSTPGRTLLSKLAEDPDASVRAGILVQFAYASAFGWNISDAHLDRLVIDSDQAVRDAMARAHINAMQAHALLPGLSADGRGDFAEQLRAQALREQPTRMQPEELIALADALLSLNESSGDGRVISSALAVLPADEQITRFNTLLHGKPFDVDQIARNSNNVGLLEIIAELGITHSQMIPESLARNPHLPEALQLRIVEMAAKAPAKADDDYDDHPVDALEELLYSDHASPAAILAASKLALARGLNPSDGSFQNALFHSHILPPEAIALLDAKLKNDGDWALTLLMQKQASVAQRVRALKRWYDDDAELQRDLRNAENFGDDEFYVLCARSKSENLQALALAQITLPTELLALLQKSAFADIARGASVHPSLSLNEIDFTQFTSDDDLAHIERLNPLDWLALSKSLPSALMRMAAYRKYGETLARVALSKP
jgi:hypothetical protein